jgi:hypothetical protein
MPSIPPEGGSSQGSQVPAPPLLSAVLLGLRALIYPPGYCPGCLARARIPWPDGATSRTCPRCLARLRRQARLRSRIAPPPRF